MSPFSPESWPFPAALLPEDAHLVGGSVRDYLLQRQSSYLDLDFILPNRALEVAAEIATACNAGFVVLDKARQIARVVFEGVTVDFAQQQGDSLTADLHRRDFTINAIAYHPHSQTIVDPLKGQADLATKTLRMVSKQNLEEDPLRLMRAYRQAAQLGFVLDPQTQRAIHQLAPLLQSMSIERIRSELDALLSIPAGTAQLDAILEHQLLSFCLPHFNAQSVRQVAQIDAALERLKQEMPDYAKRLHQWQKPVPVGSHRSWIKAAKLSQLIALDAAVAQAELLALSYSRAETQAVTTILKVQPTIELMKTQDLNRSQQFFLFKQTGERFFAVSLLALAKGVVLNAIQPMIVRFLDTEDVIAHPPTLLTGNEIMQQLAIKPSRQLGQLLKAVEQAQAEGLIRDKEAAIAWLELHGRAMLPHI